MNSRPASLIRLVAAVTLVCFLPGKSAVAQSAGSGPAPQPLLALPQFAGGDNFNGGSLNSNWNSTQITSNSGTLSLDTTHGNLTFTTPSTSDSFSLLTWSPTVANTGDWQASVDISLTALQTLGEDGHVSIALAVFKAGTNPAPDPVGTGNNLTFALNAANELSSNSFEAQDNLAIGAGQVGGTSVSSASGVATLLIQWNSTTQTLSDYFSLDSGSTWQPVSTGMSVPSQWSMSPGDQFQVGIVGDSKDNAVSGDTAFADNFATANSLSTLVIVPEPGACVLLPLGLAMMAILRLRSRHLCG